MPIAGCHPLRSAIVFRGFELGPGGKLETGLSVKRRPLLEFIGDSITRGEGILHAGGAVINSDGLAVYAWLTGEALGISHAQIAFSGIGVITSDSERGPASAIIFRLEF